MLRRDSVALEDIQDGLVAYLGDKEVYFEVMLYVHVFMLCEILSAKIYINSLHCYKKTEIASLGCRFYNRASI